MKIKILVVSFVLLVVTACSDELNKYRVHFVDGTSVDVECLVARQNSSWGNPEFVCDGTVYGNITYAEKINE